MSHVRNGTNIPIPPDQASSSNIGSPDGSGPDLEGIGPRATTMEEKINAINLQLPISHTPFRRSPRQWLLRQIKIAYIEQIVGNLVARLTTSETNAACGSEGPDSTRSWNVLGRSDSSIATGALGSHGPGSSDDNRNTRLRLDTSASPDDEQARSAVLVRFPRAQYITGVTEWFYNALEKADIPPHNRPTRIHCKAGSVLARLVL